MALVVETGSGDNPAADTYTSVAELQAYMTKRGLTPPEDAACEPLLIRAMDYIAAQEDRFKGARVTAVQPLSWPRRGVWIFGNIFPNDAIPVQLKSGQCELAIAAQTLALMPTVDPSQSSIKRDKTGPLETEFFGPAAGIYSQPVITAADAVMAVLYTGGAFSITVDRA